MSAAPFPIDWRDIKREWTIQLREHMPTTTVPIPFPARLRQPNFMTPERLGWVRAIDGTPAEVSTGVFLDDRLVALSFPDVGDPRSGVVDSWGEARERLSQNVAQ